MNRARIEQARNELGAVVWFSLDLDLSPDNDIDKEHIRKALDLLTEALKGD